VEPPPATEVTIKGGAVAAVVPEALAVLVGDDLVPVPEPVAEIVAVREPVIVPVLVPDGDTTELEGEGLLPLGLGEMVAVVLLVCELLVQVPLAESVAVALAKALGVTLPEHPAAGPKAIWRITSVVVSPT